MKPLWGENGLVTKPVLPGTGVPYRKSSPFFEVARVAGRVLRSVGGAPASPVAAGVGDASVEGFVVSSVCLRLLRRGDLCSGSPNARLNLWKKFSNGPGSAGALPVPIMTIDIIKTNHFTLSRLTLFISQIRVPTRILLSADYFAQPLFNNSIVSWTAMRQISIISSSPR